MKGGPHQRALFRSPAPQPLPKHWATKACPPWAAPLHCKEGACGFGTYRLLYARRGGRLDATHKGTGTKWTRGRGGPRTARVNFRAKPFTRFLQSLLSFMSLRRQAT